MFSGLIAYLGRVDRVTGDAHSGMRLVLEAPEAIADGVEIKDSIAVNGVCLTAVDVAARTVTFDVVPETINRSTFGALRADDPVNLELSLRLGDRLGGHLVYGHVDATAQIIDKQSEGQGHRLTVAPGRFTIALIPETSKRTTLGSKTGGARVNLEVDPVARYAQAAVAAYGQNGASHDELAWAYEI
jgi:riboflavin synthase